MLFAESLELALNVEGYSVSRFSAPDEARTPQTILTAVSRFQPQIVLLDLDLGRFGDGTALINPMAKAGINVVVVTASTDQARWGQCMRYGARKVVAKSRPLNEILSTVRRLSQGLPVTTREDRDRLIATWQREGQERAAILAKLEQLTPREEAVLGLLMRGQSVRDIAHDSVVSEATVRTQVKSILAKLEVSSQLAAVGLAVHASWRPRSDH